MGLNMGEGTPTPAGSCVAQCRDFVLRSGRKYSKTFSTHVSPWLRPVLGGQILFSATGALG